jgi:signal transduction histidine kinase
LQAQSHRILSLLQGVLLGFGVGVLLTAVASWVMVRRHLSRRVAAERRARAAERLAETGAMTGGLAHEIKNPLSTIGLNVQLLAESVDEMEVGDETRSRLMSRLQTLRREIDRLTGILSDFLEFAGQVHLERRETDLNALVEELVDFYLPEAERHHVRLRADPSPDRAVAVVDPRVVKQAALNLMLNATQAMAGAHDVAAGPSAGELILRVRMQRRGDGTPAVEMHVIDTGPGIEQTRAEQIFQPYFTTRTGGSGLGLPTARRLIEEHGGHIDVHSEVGRGTDFTIVLPLEPPTDV